MRNGLVLGCVLAMLGVPGHTLHTLEAQSPGSDRQAAPGASSQEATAVLGGIVRDSSGAVIVGATVKVHDSANRTIVATTDGSGRYLVSGLTPGPSEVSVTAAGFTDFVSADILLTAKETTSLDVPMQLVRSTTNVDVTAGRATQVETENAELSGTLSREQMVSFGLNGRNFSALITLAPGVSNQTGQDEAKVGVVGSAKFSVNGGRTEYNTFNIDGNDVLNTDIAASHGHSTLLVYPSLDAIQEMKVLTSNYGAQYGRSASGTVLVTTRSGTDQFHGNAYEFIRNEAFNSRNYFDAPGKAPLYRRQDFGFTIGGPLFIPHLYHPKVNKTFFFISEEWRKERTPVQFNQGVPTDAERGYNLATQSYSNIADFSDVCPTSIGANISFSTIKYPDCPGIGFGGAKQTYPSNQFYIDPNAKAILQKGLIPRANSSTGCISSIGSCYVGTVSPATDYREDLLRIDHTINDRWKLFATAVHDHWTTVTAVPQWGNYVNSFPSVMNSFLGPGTSGIVHLTTVVTPTLLNDFSVGATKQKISLEDIPGPGVSLDRSALGNVQDPMGSFFPENCSGGESGPNNSCIGGKIPGLVFSGTNAEYGGAGFNVDTSYMPWFSSRVVGTITDNVSKYLGRHTLQFGAQLVGARRNEFGAANGANSGDVQGVLTFRNVSSFNTSGNAFADFEYNNSSPSYSPQYGGRGVYSFQQDNAQATYKVFYWTLEPFFQDDFKVTSRLTVNVGLRLSLFDNWKPVDNVLYNWDPKAFNPGLAASHNISINPLSGYLQDATTFVPIPINTTNLNPVLTNGLVQCGANGVPGSCQTSHLFNTAPRIGLAWDPTGSGKTSIRAGYGVFFEHGTGSEGNVGSLMSNPPQTLSMTEQYPASYASIGSAGTPGTSTYTRIQSPLNVVSIPTQTVWPYVQQWSFGVQREVARDTEVGIAYVGSKGTHLAVAMQLNQLPPVPAASNPFAQHQPITQDLCLANQVTANNLTDPTGHFAFPDGTYLYYGPNAAGQPYNPTAFMGLVAACNGTQGVNGHPSIAYDSNFVRPDQGIGKVLAIRNAASSNYSSLQFTVRHAHAPLDLTLSYTYSHSIDSASDRFSSTFVNSYNLAANRASSDFDQRHLLNISYIYQLPLLRLAQFFGDPNNWVPWGSVSDAGHSSSAVSSYNGPSSITRMLLASWSLSGITTFQTGTPFSVINSASTNGISVLDNAGLALGEGADSYPDVIPSTGSPCSRVKDSGTTIGPILGDSCRFVAPRGLTQGNAGRNYLNNPSRTNFDVAVLKDIKTWHEMSLQFRAESFNVFNHTQFILYDANRGNTSSNTIGCYGDVTAGYSAGASTCTSGNGFLHPIAAHRPRTIQFGLKLQY